MTDDLKHLEILKEELCEKRLLYASLNKSGKWDKVKLHKILSSLKKNKSRDAQGLINEIFTPGVAGADLENSLLQMFNKMKDEISFPEFMQFVNIVCIYKGKGDTELLKVVYMSGIQISAPKCPDFKFSP